MGSASILYMSYYPGKNYLMSKMNNKHNIFCKFFKERSQSKSDVTRCACMQEEEKL